METTDGTLLDVAARLARAARVHPTHDALRWPGGHLDWATLDERVSRGVGALRGLGVEIGDPVGIVGDGPSFVEAFLATQRAGAVAVPLLEDLAPDELRHAILDSRARVVLVGGRRLDALVGLEDVVRFATIVPLAGGGDDAWSARCADAGPEDAADVDPGAVAALVYTSGTTGRPRGAMLSRRGLAVNQDQSLAGRLPVTADDVVCIGMPLAHIYGLNVGLGVCVTAGATIALPASPAPADVLDAVDELGATVVLGSPPLFVAWLATDQAAAPGAGRVRLALSGAAPLSVQVIERFRAVTGLAISEGYGLVEASPSVAATGLLDDPPPGSVGLPLPGVEIRLVDDAGDDVLAGDVGELWVRGPNVFLGYHRDPTATAAVLTEDGWLRTGDVATRDDKGLLYLVDRLTDLVNVDGFSVYPGEVERVLMEDPSVAQAGVVGTPHPVTGEALVAYVVAAPGARMDVEALAARCDERLARYKRPMRIEAVDSLPYTASGKMRRTVLRAGE